MDPSLQQLLGSQALLQAVLLTADEQPVGRRVVGHALGLAHQRVAALLDAGQRAGARHAVEAGDHLVAAVGLGAHDARRILQAGIADIRITIAVAGHISVAVSGHISVSVASVAISVPVAITVSVPVTISVAIAVTIPVSVSISISVSGHISVTITIPISRIAIAITITVALLLGALHARVSGSRVRLGILARRARAREPVFARTTKREHQGEQSGAKQTS
jgi:hypothetical protein